MTGTAKSAAGERGSVTPFAVVAAVSMLLAIGLVVDGGNKIRALQQAEAYAAAAARAGGQAINAGAAIEGNQPTIDHAAALTTARQYLNQARVSGTARFVNPTTMAVDTTVSRPTVFLGLIGIGRVTAHGNATVTLIRGVTGPGQ